MPLLGLMLYGSCARGDNTPTSDVDILAVRDEEPTKKVIETKVNISFYSALDLTRMSREGALFTIHLHKEGRVLYEARPGLFEGLLGESLTHFRLKRTLGLAAELYRCIDYIRPRSRNFRLINARTCWVVRTVLMAHSVQDGRPTFRSEQLLSMFNAQRYGPLIDAKKSDDNESAYSVLLDRFAAEYLRELLSTKAIDGLRDYVESSPYRKDLRGLVGGFFNEDSGEYS
jgi:hypothetical protein